MNYTRLLAATLFATVASYGAGFGRSVAMSQLGYTATAVGLTTAIGGAISLPVPLVLGGLSDRIGRKRLLILCYATGLAALPALGFASTPWGFWAASALLGVMMTSQPLQQALATDMLPRDLVGRGLALLGSAQALSILTGSLLVGAAFQGLGARTTFLLWTLAPLAAIALLSQVREPRRCGGDGAWRGDCPEVMRGRDTQPAPYDFPASRASRKGDPRDRFAMLVTIGRQACMTSPDSTEERARGRGALSGGRRCAIVETVAQFP